MAQSETASIRLSGWLGEEIKRRIGTGWRDTAGSVVSETLERYFSLLTHVTRGITLTHQETSLLCAVQNGCLEVGASGVLLWANIADTELGYAEHFGVDRDAFAKKLQEWGLAVNLALSELCELAWNSRGHLQSDQAMFEPFVKAGICEPYGDTEEAATRGLQVGDVFFAHPYPNQKMWFRVEDIQADVLDLHCLFGAWRGGRLQIRQGDLAKVDRLIKDAQTDQQDTQ